MNSDATFAMTGATIDMIVDTFALSAEITEMAGGIAATIGGTVASGETTDGGINNAKYELPGCPEHGRPGNFDLRRPLRTIHLLQFGAEKRTIRPLRSFSHLTQNYAGVQLRSFIQMTV